MKSFVEGNGFKYLADIEKEHKCAGFCEKPLFYVTKPANERPSKECIKPIV